MESNPKGEERRKIRLIECRYLKITLRQVFYLYEAPPLLRPHTPSNLTHCIRVYSIFIHAVKGGGGS